PRPAGPLQMIERVAQHGARETVVRSSEPALESDRTGTLRPPTAPLDARRIAGLVVVGAWAVCVLARLSRLACGCLVLTGLKRKAVEVVGESDRLLGECRAMLGLSRRVGLAVHPAVASPVVVGGL